MLAAEDVASTPDLEVGERDLEPGTELGRVEDRLEPLPSLLAHPLAPPVEQIGVGPSRRPSDPAPELVQLGKPEGVGAVDDDRVRVRDVQSGLDDRRADEDVGVACRERDHHALEVTLGHLAMADDEAGAGQHPPKLLRLGLDRLDPVVDEEDLAAPVELAQDRVADEAGRRFRDPGLDRQAILRRRLDHRHVANPGEGEVEGPRDRRRAQRQDVDLAPELLELLLRSDAEALLLVDDDEPEVPELHVLREQAMGSDHEVDRAVGEAVDRGCLIARGHEPRQKPNPDRKRGEALAERLVMLCREDRRRDQHRDLLAVLDRLEGGSQRDLGLAVADVADDEPIHRPAGLHVELDLDDGTELIGSLLVREARLHLALPRRVGSERVAGGVRPRGVQGQELLRQIRDGLADALLGLEPLGAAELRELGVLRAAVA